MKQRLIRYCCVFFLTHTIVNGNAQSQKMQDVEKSININALMDSFGIPALSIAVIDNYKIDWAKAYGAINLSDKALTDTNSLFQAASLSKTVNAVLIMSLVQQKKLSLDSDIRNYLHTWKFPDNDFSKGEKITLRDLLSHESGIGIHGFDGYLPEKELPTLNEILYGKLPANNQPVVPVQPEGKEYYSGGGIIVSQKILADNFSDSYSELVAKYVLQPVNMYHSLYEQPLAKTHIKNAAHGYRKDSSGLKDITHVYPELAAAGLWTTATDYARLIISIQCALDKKNNVVLNETSARQMLTQVRGYGGLGVAIQNKNGYLYFSHNGRNQGFSNQYIGSYSGGKGVVILTNGENFELINKLIDVIAKTYNWIGY